MKKWRSWRVAILLLTFLLTMFTFVTVAADELPVDEAKGEQFDIKVSTVLADPGWEAKNLLDGDTATCWSSGWSDPGVPLGSEWMQFDFREVKKVESIILTPSSSKNCFPVDFYFESSIDGDSYFKIEGSEESGYKIASALPRTFAFDEPVIARYIRLQVTMRSPDGNGNHMVHIAECDAQSTAATEEEIRDRTEYEQANKPIKFTISASTSLDDSAWSDAHLSDGNPATPWSSEWVNVQSPECEEWILIQADQTAKFTSVKLWSTSENLCFPADFKFQYSFDGTKFLDIPGAAYTDYDGKASTEREFVFETPQVADSIRIFITKKTANTDGNYLVQMSLVEPFAEKPTQEEIAAAQEIFNKTDAPVEEKTEQTADHSVLAFCLIGVLGGLAVVSILFFVIFLVRKKPFSMQSLKFLAEKKRLFAILSAVFLLLCVGMGVLTGFSVDYIVEVEIGEGHNVYKYPEGATYDYRYGPSFFYNDKHELEAWFSAPGSSGAWDFLTYQKSTDEGKTWSEEFVSIQPTSGSLDSFSTCDPGAFKIGEYYYVGYTSTYDAAGTYNNVYVARSKSPEGPWEKWSGNGWGNDPQPTIFYVYNSDAVGTIDPNLTYGVGEPSYVVKGDKIYCYYTMKGVIGTKQIVNQTRLSIADATDPNWPATLQEVGTVITNKDNSEDSWDVKYIPEIDKFLAVCTYKRFTTSSEIKMYLADDGVNFYPIHVNSDKAQKRLHNIGISGDESGHLHLSDNNYVMYAYALNGLDWGMWYTDINSVTFKVKKVINFGKNFRGDIAVDPPFEDGAPYVWALSEASEQRCADMAADGNPETIFSSMAHERKEYYEALFMRTGGSVKGVVLTPRAGGLCFPKSFRFQYSDNATVWKDIEGAQYSDYTVTSDEPITFTFDKKVKAPYIRIVATELTETEFGAFAFQLAEMELI